MGFFGRCECEYENKACDCETFSDYANNPKVKFLVEKSYAEWLALYEQMEKELLGK